MIKRLALYYAAVYLGFATVVLLHPPEYVLHVRPR